MIPVVIDTRPLRRSTINTLFVDYAGLHWIAHFLAGVLSKDSVAALKATNRFDSQLAECVHLLSVQNYRLFLQSGGDEIYLPFEDKEVPQEN